MLGTSKSISGFDPRSIVGCSLWLDAADASTVTGTTTVTAWNDKSGRGYSLVPGSGTTSYANNAITINSSYLYGSGAVDLTTFTFFIVAKNIGTTSNQPFFAARPNTTQTFDSTDGFGWYMDSGNQTRFFGRYISSTGQWITTSINTLNTRLYAVTGTSAGVYTQWNNGTLGNTVTSSSRTGTAQGFTVGGEWDGSVWRTYTNSGSIYEVIVYNQVLTTTQRQTVEGYLAWKWGLQVQAITTPLSISTCVLWLDAADSSTVTGTTTVTAWRDKSTKAYTLAPGSGTTSYASSAITLSTSYLFATGAVDLTTFTFFVVVKNNNTTTNIPLFAARPNTSASYNSTDGFGFYLDGQTQTRFYGGYPTGGQSITTTGLTTSAATLISVTGTSAGVFQQWNNGTIGGTATYTTRTSTAQGFSVGGEWLGSSYTTYSSSSSIYEVIVYNSVLSTTQRQSVENYLSKKWSITISSGVPTTHPFYSLPAFSRPFGPTDIPGCALWLDGADPAGTGVVPANGASISSWIDKSGNRYNATVYSGRTAATWSAASNCVYFQASTVGYQTSYPANPSTETMFIVANIDSPADGNNNAIICGDSGARSFGFGYSGSGGTGRSGSGYLNSRVAWASTWIAGPSPGTTALVTGTVITTSSIACGLNGSNLTAGTVSAFSSSAGTTLGVDTTYTPIYFKGYVMDIIFYSRVLGTTERQQVEGYLAAKWGLLNNLPGKTLSPLNIPGCALWLDASDATTLTLSSSTVTQWRDKSGNSNNTNTVNGSPTYSSNFISLNGTSTYLVGPYVNTTQYLTAFVVGSVNFSLGSYGTYYRLLSVGSTAANDYNSASYAAVILHNPNTTQIGGYRNSQTNYVSVTTNSNFLVMNQYDGTNATLYLNGTAQTPVSSTGSFNTSSYSIGRDVGNTDGGSYTYWPGTVGEVIIYNSVLTTTQRQSVENYLMSKWGISNVTTHPFKSIPPSTSQPPQFQEVTPGNWTYDWKPYLSNLAAANSGATASIGTSITPSVSGGFAATLAPNGNLYTYSWSGTGITVVNTNSGSLVTTITGTGIQGERYFSSCLGPDGNIYYPPYNLSTVGILYTATNTFSASAITMGTSPSSGAYCGAVLAPNGKIYCIPRAYGTAASIGIIDTVAKTFNIMPSAVVTANQGYIGGVLAPNGKIYCIPFVDSGSVSVGIIDPDANTFTTMPSSSVSTVGAYNGGVLAPNGKIYCIPYNATNVGIIDPVANTFNTTTITNAPGSAAYTGGCLGPNGKIYFAPRSATAFGVVDPTANTLATTGGVSGTSGTGYTGAFLTSAGKFYCPNLGTVVNVVNFSSLNQTPSLNYCLSAYTNKS